MIGLTASVAMQVALLATSASAYQDAYDQADKEGKPLLVLVGADWCPGCRTMKDEMIPELERDGGLVAGRVCDRQHRREADAVAAAVARNLHSPTGVVHAHGQGLAALATDRCP